MQISKQVPKDSGEIHPVSLENETLTDKILGVLSDSYSRNILAATIEQPKAASTLTGETGIPISTIYRRLQNLLDVKLLKVSGTISKEGKKYFLYQSKIKEIHSVIQGSNVEIKLVWADNHETEL